MRNFFKKVGSLALGVGALALVMANAALTHGCASSPAKQAEAPSKGNAAVEEAKSNPNCEVPEYMYATKAPIWVPPECYGGNPAATQPQQQAPAQHANSEQDDL